MQLSGWYKVVTKIYWGELGVVVRDYNPSPQEAQVEGSL